MLPSSVDALYLAGRRSRLRPYNFVDYLLCGAPPAVGRGQFEGHAGLNARLVAAGQYQEHRGERRPMLRVAWREDRCSLSQRQCLFRTSELRFHKGAQRERRRESIVEHRRLVEDLIDARLRREVCVRIPAERRPSIVHIGVGGLELDGGPERRLCSLSSSMPSASKLAATFGSDFFASSMAVRASAGRCIPTCHAANNAAADPEDSTRPSKASCFTFTSTLKIRYSNKGFV